MSVEHSKLIIEGSLTAVVLKNQLNEVDTFGFYSLSTSWYDMAMYRFAQGIGELRRCSVIEDLGLGKFENFFQAEEKELCGQPVVKRLPFKILSLASSVRERKKLILSV